MPIYDKSEIEDITLQVMTSLLWKSLVEYGEYELLYKLNILEKYNFGSMIIPSYGFSSHDNIHNMVIDWLRLKGINAWNPENEILKAERALHD